MGFMVTYAWFMIILGACISMWTLGLLAFSRCGKNLTHWSPILCDAGWGQGHS